MLFTKVLSEVMKGFTTWLEYTWSTRIVRGIVSICQDHKVEEWLPKTTRNA